MNDLTEKEKPLHPVVVFKQNLKKLIEDKELALPSNVSEESFRNAAVVAIQDNPDLLRADQQTLFKSLRRSAAAGLVPDGREGALVTFKTKDKASNKWVQAVQFMPMVFGLIKMARRSGTVSDIRAHIVYQNEVDQDKFNYTIGDTETLRHEPILFGDKGEAVAAYAIARMKDGTIVREFMSKDEIDTVRRAGSSQKVYRQGQAPKTSDEPLGIWKDWANEMWKKTVIRRLTKRLDLSSEDVRHIMDDDDFEGIRDVTPKRKEPEAGKFAEKAKKAAKEAEPKAPIEPEDPAPEVEDAEIIPEGEGPQSGDEAEDPSNSESDTCEEEGYKS